MRDWLMVMEWARYVSALVAIGFVGAMVVTVAWVML